MKNILLINPNSSESTTAMMVKIARDELPADWHVEGLTARRGPSMIVTPTELKAAAAEVEGVWLGAGRDWAGVIVSAFGDPGIERVRASCDVPVTGIAEASMLEAGQGGRRFGIATVTPHLVDAIEALAEHAGVLHLYTGIRLTDGDPRRLAADPKALEDALARAVEQCIYDGAEAVIIGGGPLGQAAIGLASRFTVPVIAPIPSAVRRLVALVTVRDRLTAATPRST